MIELIDGLPDGVVGLEAVGEVTSDDYELVATPAVERARIAVVTDHKHFRALVKGAGWSLPGEMRLFSNADRREAEAWVSEGLERESSGSPG